MQVAANRSGVCTRLLDGGSHADPAPDFPLGHGSRVFVDSGIFAASVVARYRPQGCKKSKKQAKKAAKELGYTRKDWLEQDVIYIITPGEREAFLKLGTNEERDQFMDTFWRNRNPDPDSPENSFNMDYALDYFRVTNDSVLVPITLQIPNRAIAYRDNQGVHSANLNLCARITTPAGRLVQTIEEAISRDIPSALFQKTLDQSSMFQKSVPLSPGLYRLDVVVKDMESGNVGVIDTALRVPRFEKETLGASTLILADKIEPVPAAQIGHGPFVLGSYKVRPRLLHEFSNQENLGLFLQIYNLRRDQALQRPSIFVSYKLLKNHEEVWTATETSDSIRQTGEQVTLNRLIPLAAFAPGSYTLLVAIQDQVSSQSISREAGFQIKPQPKP